MAPKNWDAICRDLSSGEDSDEHDTLNVVKVKRNAHRVAELMRGVVLGDDAAAPPKGMNNAEALRRHLLTSGRAGAMPDASPHSHESSTSADAAAPPKEAHPDGAASSMNKA